MSEKSKAELVREALKKYASIEEMKAKTQEIADQVSCSRSLVYKEINRIAETMKLEVLPEAKEPVVRIEKPEEIEMPAEEEQVPKPLEEEEILPPPEEEEITEEPEEEKEKPKVELTDKMVKVLFAKPFEIASRLTKCKDIELTEKEKTELCDAWLPYLEANLPEALAEHFPLIYAGYVTMTVVGSKAIAYREWKSEQEEKPKEPEKSEPSKPEEPKAEPFKQPEDLEKKKSEKPSFLKKL